MHLRRRISRMVQYTGHGTRQSLRHSPLLWIRELQMPQWLKANAQSVRPWVRDRTSTPFFRAHPGWRPDVTPDCMHSALWIHSTKINVRTNPTRRFAKLTNPNSKKPLTRAIITRRQKNNKSLDKPYLCAVEPLNNPPLNNPIRVQKISPIEVCRSAVKITTTKNNNHKITR